VLGLPRLNSTPYELQHVQEVAVAHWLRGEGGGPEELRVAVDHGDSSLCKAVYSLDGKVLLFERVNGPYDQLARTVGQGVVTDVNETFDVRVIRRYRGDVLLELFRIRDSWSFGKALDEGVVLEPLPEVLFREEVEVCLDSLEPIRQVESGVVRVVRTSEFR